MAANREFRHICRPRAKCRWCRFGVVRRNPWPDHPSRAARRQTVARAGGAVAAPMAVAPRDLRHPMPVLPFCAGLLPHADLQALDQGKRISFKIGPFCDAAQPGRLFEGNRCTGGQRGWRLDSHNEAPQPPPPPPTPPYFSERISPGRTLTKMIPRSRYCAAPK